LTPDAGAPIKVEFGVGRETADPGVAWEWRSAPFNAIDGNNNQYAFSYTPDGGAPNYAFRFSKNDGGTWCYGDNDGNGANGASTPWAGFSGLGGNLGTVVP